MSDEKKILDLVITADVAVEGIRKAVEAKGANFVANDPDAGDSGCQYANDAGTGPLCIVGTVLFDLGVPATELAYMDEVYGQTIDATDNVRHLKSLGVTMEPAARNFLEVAQAHQDGGGTWGDAQALALEALGRKRG